MYETAKNYRAKFKKNHGQYERMLVSIRRPGIRIELYRRDPGQMMPNDTILVVVDDLDRKRPVPFDHESMVQKYRKFGTAFFWFRVYCKRYGIHGSDLDRAIRNLYKQDFS